MAVIDELVTLISFSMPSTSTSALKKAENGISGITKGFKDLSIAAVAAGSVATAAAGVALSASASKAANELTKESRATGLLAEDLQALGSVYKSLGGDAANAANDARAFMKETNAPLDSKAIQELSDFFKDIPDSQAIMGLGAMGLSEDLLQVIRLSEEERESRLSYAKENHALTQQEINDLKIFNEVWANFGSTVDTVYKRIGSVVSLPTGNILKDITEFLNENADSIAMGFEKVARGFENVYTSAKGVGAEAWEEVKPLFNALDGFVEKHVGWENALTVTGVAIAGLSVAAVPAALALTTAKLIGMTGALGGLGAAGVKMAGVFGVGGVVIASLIAADDIINKLRKNVSESVAQINADIDSIKDPNDAKKARANNLKTSVKKALIGPISAYEAIGEYFARDERISENIAIANGKMTEEELRDVYGKDLVIGDESAKFFKAAGVHPQGYLTEDKTGVFETLLNGLKYALGPGESIQRLRDRYEKQNQPSVTIQNEININGVRGAEQVAPAVGSAAAMGSQNGISNAYKGAVPDSFIGVH